MFNRDQSVVSRHINNSFSEEVDKKSNMHFLHIANSDKPVMIAESDPKEKDIMTTLVMNLIRI